MHNDELAINQVPSLEATISGELSCDPTSLLEAEFPSKESWFKSLEQHIEKRKQKGHELVSVQWNQTLRNVGSKAETGKKRKKKRERKKERKGRIDR